MSDCLHYCRMDLYIPAGKLFFIYLMTKNTDWIHSLYVQPWRSRSSSHLLKNCFLVIQWSRVVVIMAAVLVAVREWFY